MKVKRRVSGLELKEALSFGTVPIKVRSCIGFGKHLKGKIVHVFGLIQSGFGGWEVSFVDSTGKEDSVKLNFLHDFLPAYFAESTR